MTDEAVRFDRTKSSMLWSAWADALGFISELTSPANLQRRTKGRALTEPFPWSRLIGGHAGVRVNLPAGSYSDDTQLRLATSRAISGDGFDVEAFARVELTVWPSYALGGGRASRAAATSMARRNANWSANFFPGWTTAGGNGAAMRIQPHVYAAENLGSYHHLADVLKNAVVTHGHPRALVGAVLHAATVTFALENGRVPQPVEWCQLLDVTREALYVFTVTPELASYWLPQWEKTTDIDFHSAWLNTIDEVNELIQASSSGFDLLRSAGSDRNAAANAYEGIVDSLRLDEEQSRGSGTATTVAALLLATALPDNPAHSALLAASRLNTDTDTIATMAAAIVGAASPSPLVSPVQDEAYLTSESERLTRIASGQAVSGFPYPDLLHWLPPKSGLDSVGLVHDSVALAGLGILEPRGEVYEARDSRWQWMSTSFGPTMLVKHRPHLQTLPSENWPNENLLGSMRQWRSSDSKSPQRAEAKQHTHPEQMLFEMADAWVPSGVKEPASYFELEPIFPWLLEHGFTDRQLGFALRRVIESGSPEQLRIFIETVTTELRARQGS